MRLSLPRRLGLVVFVLGLTTYATPAQGIPALAASNPVVTENQQPGSTGWQLGTTADDTNGQIKGYASATSVAQNQSITLYVTVNPAQTYTIDFYRIGWYAGLGGRFRLHVGPLNGSTQPACTPNASTGLIACNWSSSYALSIPSDWTSGIYYGVLTNAQGYQNYVTFVVRDGRAGGLLYQQSVMTDQAYNDYPDNSVTGKSLYTYNSYGAATVAGDPRAVKVSFDRPYRWSGAGDFFNWEVDIVHWLERSGYDVTYATDVDTHANGAALKNSKGFISAGHDEYWTKEMFDAVQAARDAGVGLGFFGANAVSWQVRFEASAAGVANRVMVCYKDATIDPVQGPTTTVNFRSAPVNRPEQTLMGVQTTAALGWGTTVPYVVTNSSNWAYAGTGFHDGDAVPGLVGYEMDRYMSDFPAPTSTSRTLLSQSPFTNNGVPDYSNSSIYQAPSGAWVFASGTMSWSWGLDNYDHTLADARIQQTTTNVLNKFLAGTVGPPPQLQVSGVQSGSVTATSAVISWQTNNAANTRVDYGLTTGYGSSVSDASSVLNHVSTLSSLTPSTTYHYKVTSVDGFAQTASSADGSFTTSAAPRGWAWVQGVTAADAVVGGGSYTQTIAAPAVGNFLALSAVLVDSNGAGNPSIIAVSDNGSPPSSWAKAVANTDTGLHDSGEIWYATNVTGRPTTITVTISRGGATALHEASRVDEYSGILASAPLDQTAINGDYNVTICPSGTTAATSVGQELALALYGDNTQDVVITSPAGWTERRNTPSAVGAAEVVIDRAIPVAPQSATFTTNWPTWALSAIATFKIATGPPPPLQVSGVQAGTIGPSSAVISWQSNNPANSRVDYGLTTGYGSSVSDPTRVAAHALTLASLTPSTTYHYAVTSVDGTGQTASSTDGTFTTGLPLQVSAVSAGSIRATSAVISWQTNYSASSRVDYGLTIAYGSSVSDATRVAAHALTLANLTPSTTYHYKVTSVDATGQTASSADGTVTTSAAPRGWTWVQGVSAADAVIAGSSYTQTIAAPASGNFLVLSAVLVDSNAAGNPSITSISDNGSPPSSWAKAVANADTGLQADGEIWYATNVTGRPTTITVTISRGSATALHRASRIDEYSGVASIAPLDRTAINGDYNVTVCPTGTTAATGVDQELAVALYGDNTQDVVITSPAGWTERRNSSSVIGAAEVVIDRAVPIGAQSATFTTNWPTWALSAIATFKPGP